MNTGNEISIQETKCSQSQLEKHFKSLDPDFLIELQERVNLVDYISKILAHSFQITATLDSEILGLIAYYQTPNDIYVTHLGVDKSYRRMQIATYLLEFLTNTHPQVPIRLEVNFSNEIAKEFYKKQGFNKVGNHGKYEILVL